MVLINAGGNVDNAPTENSKNLVTSGGTYTALSGKQDTLVSGTSIKTVNSTSLLGSGNIAITGVPATTGASSGDVLSYNGSSIGWATPQSGQSFNTTTVTVPAQGGTVTCTGMTSTQVVWVSPTPTYYTTYQTQGCRCTSQATNSLTFTVTKTQSSTMEVNVVWTV